MTDPWTLAVIVGLAAMTVITRSFFFISERPWRLPPWMARGLQYASIAAFAAVVVPEVLTTRGEFIDTWKDARLFGAAAGAAIYFWRRNVLMTIGLGMAVYLPLYLGLGWR